jgi:MoxR-like ATPase
MSKRYLDIEAGYVANLPALSGDGEVAHVFDADSIEAVNFALAVRRPLLVRGEPGCGKSQLAWAVARKLERVFVPMTVDSQTESRDLRWTVDTLRRLAEAQLAARSESDAESESGSKTTRRDARRIEDFLEPGPLWWAFDWNSAEEQAKRAGVEPPFRTQTAAAVGRKPALPENGAVVLIDEIDKADPSVPNGLLEAFGHGRFDVPGQQRRVELGPRVAPLIVITTNEERVLPNAFLRRCVVLQLELPRSSGEALIDFLVARGEAHFGKRVTKPILRETAKLVARDRTASSDGGRWAGGYRPGLAEYVDLLRALDERAPKNAAKQKALLERIGKFVLEKEPRDGEEQGER